MELYNAVLWETTHVALTCYIIVVHGLLLLTSFRDSKYSVIITYPGRHLNNKHLYLTTCILVVLIPDTKHCYNSQSVVGLYYI